MQTHHINKLKKQHEMSKRKAENFYLNKWKSFLMGF